MRRVGTEVGNNEVTGVNAREDQVIERFPRGIGIGIASPGHKKLGLTATKAKVQNRLGDPRRTAVV
jgi:hypothetical protein